MTVLTVTPKNKKELQMVEKILEALKIKFEEKEDDVIYSPEVVEEIKRAQKSGNYTPINPNDLWGSLGLK